jgi:hypothetical protein
VGQFACPGDVPICYGGQADLEQKRWRQSSKNDAPLAASVQGTQNKTFS